MSELIPFFVALGFIVGFYIVSFWNLFEKAGEPGWKVIIPFYNLYTFVKIAGKPGWWMILYFIPVVSIFASLMVDLEMAKKFGKTDLFAVGLFLLSPIFYPILALGDAEYQVDEKTTKVNDKSFVNEDGETIEEIPLEDW